MRPTLSDSSRETPGRVLTLMVNEPSLNAGRKLLPRVQNAAMASTSRTPTPPRTDFLWDRAHFRAISYLDLNHLTISGSLPFLSPAPLPRSRLQRTGVNVRATNVEANRAVMNAIPRGLSILPSIPERKNSGMKLTTIMNVEFNIGRRTSREASNTTSSTPFLRSAGRRRFALRCLKTFSTSTIASSTREPMAIAIPPILIVLMVSPMNFNVKTDTNKDRGMVTRDMRVVLTFIRKRKRMMTTNSPPSMRDFLILSMQLSMNLCCRNMSVATWTSDGSWERSSSMAASSLAVSSMVLASGCFVTVIRTAGLPLWEAVPSFGDLEPVLISATSASVTGASPSSLTTACPMASTSEVESTPLTIYSLPYS